MNSKTDFFSHFYFALNLGSLFSSTILVYFEVSGKWILGFLVSTGSAIIALVIFLCGSPGYQHIKPCGNPLPRVAQVFVAAFHKRDVVVPENGDDLYELGGSESAIKGSRKILHSTELKFLYKAAMMIEADMVDPNPWRLCAATQVEEAKCVLKMLSIWLCTIIYSVIFTQMASLFVEQGDVMNREIDNFEIPVATWRYRNVTGNIRVFYRCCPLRKEELSAGIVTVVDSDISLMVISVLGGMPSVLRNRHD
ncbi:protein NRT1/ PTR FAMILY 7.1-like [Vitis riparia]|uniref:protein NRT1/ PTR FAMILY 7.1-like n=1 Tax=Vitis riparia TaxID=96939 RepID=UPI00155A789C|nr:protein NRT1/ PTR FAMILY 7.1-like [Vitis riparia]